MGGVCSSASPLDRTPSELSFRAFQFVEDLNTFTYTKTQKKGNVTPVDELAETEIEPHRTSLSENKHQNLERMAPKEVPKTKGVSVKCMATKNSGSSKVVLNCLCSFFSFTNISRKVSNFSYGFMSKNLLQF
jgi:hypothetical protein